MNNLRIMIWDLETHGFNFKADKGFLLCGGIKEIGSREVSMFERNNLRADPLDDKQLAVALYDRLVQADMWVTHNGRWFDIPFVNSRLLHWGHSPLPSIPHFDTCELAFKRLKVKNSLEGLGEFLGCPTRKHKVDMNVWFRAATGDPGPLRQIVRHCINDVKLTEQVYLKLRPMGYKHPNIALLLNNKRGCPVCGKSGTIQQRGIRIGQVSKAVRYHCTKDKGGCGAWSSGRLKSTGIEVRP